MACQFSGVVWGPLGVPESLSGGPPGQNYFCNNTKTSFTFLTSVLSWVYSRVFWRSLDA